MCKEILPRTIDIKVSNLQNIMVFRVKVTWVKNLNMKERNNIKISDFVHNLETTTINIPYISVILM